VRGPLVSRSRLTTWLSAIRHSAVQMNSAGARWAVEECFPAAKNETGLDHYQVRRYDAWYRHITLSLLALAFLQVTAAQRGHQHLWTTFPNAPAA
jgi:SRSO17 transposase